MRFHLTASGGQGEADAADTGVSRLFSAAGRAAAKKAEREASDGSAEIPLPVFPYPVLNSLQHGFSLLTGPDRHNDYMTAKSQKAFRRAALRRSKTARLFCHIFIAMSIRRMVQ
ncbi:MAG: hypothetical protein IKH34_01420 [Oscillospiraceae bacterium]|nr:hypothetical protein [Oscillospiraceae bacterium]